MDSLEHAPIKSPEQIAKMRVAGRLASELLDYLTPHVKAGVTTLHINDLAHEYMTKVQGTTPATLNYAPPGHRPYPASLCTSLNNQVCHGIPNDKPLKAGDVVNVDVTVIKDGFHGDTSRMFMIGKVAPHAQRLSEMTYTAMWRGIRAVRPGATLGDIGHAIETFAKECGYSVVREFCGHGIGERFHEAPQVTHFGKPGTGMRLEAGMIFTIEPMINAGRPEIRLLPDGWTVVTADRSLSAQWEHTVLVTGDGYDILTQSEGTPAPSQL
jgi:methionyl aminopeptidase